MRSREDRPPLSTITRATLGMLFALTTVAGCERNVEPKWKPLSQKQGIRHVVLISVDTLRADHLGCYGHPFVKSPNLDTLAAEGVVFTQHINAAPSTLASHMSLMTGTYPHTHGAPKNGYCVGDENVTLAEVLKEAGFKTASFIGAFPLDPVTNFNQGFDHVDARYELEKVKGIRDQAQRRAESVTDAVIGWLEQTAPASTERLFLFVHYFDVHWPYDAPPPYGRMYRHDSTTAVGSLWYVNAARNLLHRNPEKGLELARILDAEYCAEITYCDAHIGRLFAALKQHDLYDDALIIIFSDHGETMHEHTNFFNHGRSVYETEIHTPLIIRFPRRQFAGQRIDRLVSSIDIMPSILHWLGLRPTPRMEGESFAALIDGPLPDRGPVFAEATQPWWDERFHSDRVWPNNDKYQCVRTERYKYTFRLPDSRFGLYDLSSDPLEQTNLLEGNRAHDAALVKSLRRQLEAWRAQTAPIRGQELTGPDAVQKLRSLGYTGDDYEEDETPDGPNAGGGDNPDQP